MKHFVGSWQVAGFGFTSAMGTLLHFLYDWTGKSPVVGLFSAVNESIWEHMKLLFVPMLIFSLIESRVLQKKNPDFWCIKLVGTLVGLTLIPVLYYTYTGALGVHADWFNIAIFFITAAVVYRLEARLLQSPRSCRLPSGVAFAAQILLFAIFAVLTFFPPDIPLFHAP